MPLDYPLTVGKLLAPTMHRASRNEIVYGKTRYTWVDFYARIRKLASGLEAVGVKKGSTVAVIEYDTNRYLEAYYAIPMMGAILHTVNIRLPSGYIANTMAHAGDDFVLLRDEFMGLAMKVVSSARTIKGIVTMSDNGSAPSLPFPNVWHYDDLLAQGDHDYKFPHLDENTPATMLYTSGTTGMPKGVVFSHRKLVLHALAVQIALSGASPDHRVDSGDVLMPLVPFFHVHSWGMPYWAGLCGQKIVLPGRYYQSKILELISSEHVTFSHMIPTILDMIVSFPGVEAYRDALSKWKVVVGGDPLAKELALNARKLGIHLMSGYGLSEAGPVLTLASPMEKHLGLSEDEMLDKVLLKAGLPIPMVDLRVVDSKMNDVRRDDKTMGEIVVRAPWLAEEYFRDDASTRILWAGGWLHTGDVAVVDSDGYITIKDRVRDAVRSGGEWIPSTVLEQLLVRHPSVSEAAVIGAADPKWGERPLAIVSLRQGQEITAKELLDHMLRFVEEETIVDWWLPDRFVILREPLPKTSTGKIDKAPLRSEYTAALVAR